MTTMTDDSDAASVTCFYPFQYIVDIAAVYSFFSATEDGVDGDEEFEDRDELELEEAAMKAFYLDIEKLQRVVSATGDGMACRVCRPENFEKATYFLLCARFVSGLEWDVIVPHPCPFPASPAATGEDAATNRRSFYHDGIAALLGLRTPRLMGWKAASDNEAGVPFIFVDSISGAQTTLSLR